MGKFFYIVVWYKVYITVLVILTIDKDVGDFLGL